MFEVRFTFCDSTTGQQGVLRVAGGVWVGDECVFEFADTAYGLSGAARCDWRQEQPRLEVHEGPGSEPGPMALLAQLRTLLMPFHRGAFRGIDEAALRQHYAGDYHRQMNYAVDSANETEFKRSLVDQIIALSSPRKVLDAGCSAGEVVRQLRGRGIDAWGFDLCPDLAEIAYPQVADYLRQGDVQAIPFGPEDGFDTLVALDLFEHLPEDRIGPMVAELSRLGVRTVAARIALCEFQYPGHITLRPLHWWDGQLGPAFHRVSATSGHGAMAATFAADPSRYLRIFELVPEPALV